jgi:rod shape-determining protein MreD
VNGFLRSTALVAFGFGLLIVQSTLATVLPIGPFAPSLLLPMVIFLGVSPDVHVVRGVVISFVLGYLLDLLSGNPMSLSTFVLVATFLVARGAGVRLFLRGPAFQIALTFLATLVAGGAAMTLRAVFEKPPPFPVTTDFRVARELFGLAVATAIMAPLVFALVRRIDAMSTTRRDDTGASV